MSGGIYDNGRRLSQLLRERVLDLHHDGMSPQLIANEGKSSRHFVQNVLRDYDQNNSSMPKMRETQPRSSRSYNYRNRLKPLKSRKKFQKIGSKRTNQKVTKFPETSATLRNFVGFPIFVVKPLFAFLSFIGPFTKKEVILCSQLTL